MPTDPMSAQTAQQAAAHETLVANLRNAHALEKQVITVLGAQLALVTDYPDLYARLCQHIAETREQVRRLEAGLEACGGSPSMFKDALSSAMGLGHSSVQSFGDYAFLKAVGADMMTEHLEIATYRILILLADMAGKPALRPRLVETLREEEAMAAWFDDNLESITRRFVENKASEELLADAAPAANAATRDRETPQTLRQILEQAETARAHPGHTAQPSDETMHKNATAAQPTTTRPSE